MRRLILSALAVATFALAGTTAAGAQTTVATLDGELLISCNAVGATDFGCTTQPGSRTIKIRCNADNSGRVSWVASGDAVGPYPGTFTETGTAVFGAPPATAVTQFSVTFHIDSELGEVEGRKFLPAGPPSVFGVCRTTGNPRRAIVTGEARYEAIIKPVTGGSYADEGRSLLTILGAATSPLPLDEEVETSLGFVSETFRSDHLVAPPLEPTAKEQCKDQGFAIFGIFENQGDCVSFVSTHGKNEPGQNLPGVP